MSVYLFADIEVIDESTYSEYREKAYPIIRKHGGRYIVRGGGNIVPLAGDWKPERVVMIEFESMETLRECFNSQEYMQIAPLREKSTHSRSIIVEGFRG